MEYEQPRRNISEPKAGIRETSDSASKISGSNTAIGLANKFFEPVIYLKINSVGLHFYDIHKFTIFWIIANNPCISPERLRNMVTVNAATLDFTLYHVDKAFTILENLGITKFGDSISLTDSGRALYTFLHDKEAVDSWISGIRYPDSVDPLRAAYNIKKVREVIDSEQEVIKQAYKLEQQKRQF